MSKLWEAIKNLEQERDRTSESRAIREGSERAFARYLEQIRHRRQRDLVEAPSDLATYAGKRR